MLFPDKYHVSLLCLWLLWWHIGRSAAGQDPFCAWCCTDTRRKSHYFTRLWQQTQVRPESSGTLPPPRMKHYLIPHMNVQVTEITSKFQIHWLTDRAILWVWPNLRCTKPSRRTGNKLYCCLAAHVMYNKSDGERRACWHWQQPSLGAPFLFQIRLGQDIRLFVAGWEICWASPRWSHDREILAPSLCLV